MQPIRLNDKTSAAMIRALLKKAFPTTKFSARISRGAGCSAVHIRWTDGPTGAVVDAIVKPFECGHFDGMTDGYNYNTGADRYLIIDGQTYERGVRYVFTERTISPALANRCIAQLATYWGAENAPVAIASKFGEGYEIADGRGNEIVGNGGNGAYDHNWYNLVHRAAADRTRYAAEG